MWRPEFKRPLTAWVVDPGGVFYDGRGRRWQIRDNQVGVYCEACEWAVARPLRLGYDDAVQLRNQHLERHHRSELEDGTVAWRGHREAAG
jgi:hypothetical protein